MPKLRYICNIFQQTETREPYRVRCHSYPMREYKFARVKTRTFPTMADVRHPYIFGGVGCVINVSEREDEAVKYLYRSLGIRYHHFPTKEECEEMSWDNIKAATKVLINNISADIPTIVHCIGGNNRSPMIVECAYYALHGSHLADEYRTQLNHLIYNSRFFGLSIEDMEHELKQLTE